MNRTQASCLLAIVLAAALSGCVAGAPTATTAPTSTSTPEASTSPPATPTAPPGEVVPCDEVFTDEFEADMTAAGFEPSDGMFTAVELDRILASGGTVCKWGQPGTDSFIVVGQLATSPDEWDPWRTELEGFGWTEQDEPLPGTLWSDRDAIGYRYGMLYRDGMLYFGAGADVLGSVAALQ